MNQPAKDVQEALLASDILAGTAGDPNILRLLPPFILKEEHIDLLRAALTDSTHEKLSRSGGPAARASRRAARPRRTPGAEAGAAGAGRQDSRPAVLQSVAAHARVVPGRHGAARRHLVRDLAGPGHVAARDAPRRRDERRSGGARARRHSRTGLTTATRWASARSRTARISRPTSPKPRSRRWSAWSNKPLINMESAINHPCQALADWKTMDDLGVPRNGKFVLSWVNHPRALPLAVPAATVHMAAHARHGSRGAAARRVRAAAGRSCRRPRRPRPPSGGSVRETADRDDALAGAHVVYAKEWGSTAHYGDAEGRRAPARRRSPTGACATPGSRAPPSTASSCIACRCGAMSPSPTKCSTARAASCSAKPTTAWSCRWRCCTGCSRLRNTNDRQRNSRMIMHRPDHAAAIRACAAPRPTSACTRARPSS